MPWAKGPDAAEENDGEIELQFELTSAERWGGGTESISGTQRQLLRPVCCARAVNIHEVTVRSVLMLTAARKLFYVL